MVTLSYQMVLTSFKVWYRFVLIIFGELSLEKTGALRMQ